MLTSIHSLISQNLITNGDFSSGGISPATSDCNFTQTGGSYYVTTNPNTIPGWSWATPFTGNGNFMAIDVPETSGGVIWRSQDILSNVLTNGTYRVSLRATSLSNVNQPKFHIRVKRYASNIFPYTFEESAVFNVTSVGNFTNYQFDDPYISGIGSVATKVVIEIVNDQPTWWGNDLAIDDVSMMSVGGPVVCTYSQPNISIVCKDGDNHLVLSTNVTGTTSPIAHRLTFGNSSNSIVPNDINLTQNPLYCSITLGQGSFSIIATASGCSNSSASTSYTWRQGSGGDCDACTGGCPTYTDGQFLLNWYGETIQAKYCNGILYARATWGAWKHPNWLIGAGMNPTLAACFATYNPGCGALGRMAAVQTGDEIDDNIVVSPNPTTGKIKITFSLLKAGNVWINLYDAQAKSLDLRDIEGKVGHNEIEYDLQNYPAGAYFINLQSSEKREVLNVMKIN